MSTIKVNKIENTSTTAGGVAIDVDGHVTIDGQQMPTAGPFSNRNMIINGAMEVDQRNDGSSISLTGTNFPVDRFQARAQSITTATAGRSTDAPTGFTNSIFVNVGATAVARSAGDNRQIRQLIEGYVVRKLFWGTANAKPATISFWVKSSVTGTFDFAFFSGVVDQSYITQYTIDTANTWEYKTISVPGATSGTFNTDTQVALYCHWDLGSGSDYQSSTLDQWISGDKRASTSGTDLFATANANFYLTGVQLEEGDKSTPFEHRSYADVLQKCYRYYQRLGNVRYVPVGVGVQGSSTNTASRININMRAPMRTGPTINYSNIILTDRSAFDNTVNSYSGLASSETGVFASFFSASNGGANGNAILLTANHSGYLELKAEL